MIRLQDMTEKAAIIANLKSELEHSRQKVETTDSELAALRKKQSDARELLQVRARLAYR